MSLDSDEKPLVGFVGLGNMGVPMAARLAGAGFALAVHDIDAAAVARVRGEHGAAALDAGELARCDVLFLMLPDGRIVRDYLLTERPGGAPAALLKPGAVVVDMSSSAPLGTRDLGEVLGQRGIAFLDAPVSGGVGRAKTGALAMMLGGDEAVADRVRPLLAAMASSIFHVGPLGSGHAMKALNNYVSAAGLLTASEALRVARTFGITGERVIDVLNASTGRNNSTENKLGAFVLSERFNSGFGLSLMRKDLETALGLAKDLGVEMPLGDRCIAVWQEAERMLGKSADHTEIARMVQGPDLPA